MPPSEVEKIEAGVIEEGGQLRRRALRSMPEQHGWASLQRRI
jgi:hypothetical protein